MSFLGDESLDVEEKETSLSGRMRGVKGMHNQEVRFAGYSGLEHWRISRFKGHLVESSDRKVSTSGYEATVCVR